MASTAPAAGAAATTRPKDHSTKVKNRTTANSCARDQCYKFVGNAELKEELSVHFSQNCKSEALKNLFRGE